MNLTKEGILNYLKNEENFNITVLSETESTNSLLKELAKQGAREGTVIIADSQTGGRGRYDRKFHSPKGCGIYMSILLKPTLPATDSVLITAAAATAVSEAVLKVSGKTTQIKWVNDLLLDNKKICGILTEGSLNTETGGFNWAVLGIGINVYEPQEGYHSEIKSIAGAVTDKKEESLRNRLAAEIINCFYKYYKNLESREFLKDYRLKSCVLGKKITVIKNNSSPEALALEIDNNCRLLVEYENGEKEYLSSGEISIKLK